MKHPAKDPCHEFADQIWVLLIQRERSANKILAAPSTMTAATKREKTIFMAKNSQVRMMSMRPTEKWIWLLISRTMYKPALLGTSLSIWRKIKVVSKKRVTWKNMGQIMTHYSISIKVQEEINVRQEEFKVQIKMIKIWCLSLRTSSVLI